jgi:hypothetical protein
MHKRLGLLLVLIPMIASAAFVLKDAAEHARPTPAPKKLEAPSSTPTESSDDSHSQVPQRPPGEIIGVPMLA